METKSNPDGTVTATGTALAGSRVTVTFPDGTSKIVTAGADGKYTATSETAQPSGKVNAVVTDNNGKTSLPAVKDYVDNVAPKSPEAVSVMDEVGAVTGKIKPNDLTDDARPVMSGKAEAGSTVTIYDGAVKLGTTIADAAGNWTFRPATALAEGEHKITFTATDKAGNTSPATEPLVFKVDTVAPPVPVLKEAVDSEGTITGAIAASGVTDDTRPEFKGEGAEAGTTIRFFDNGVEIGSTVVGADGKWSFTPEIGLQQGVHRITMQAQDIAGNKSAKSETFQFEVDTTPPTAPLVSEIRDNTGSITGNITTGKTTDETKPTLTGSGAEAGSTVKIYDKGVLIGETTADSKGTWTFTPTTALAEGEHVFTVTATDKAGNEGISSPSWTIIVDTTAPDQPTIALVADAAGTELDAGAITSERRPILSGEAEAGSTVTIYDNGKKLGTVVAEDDGTWSFELKSNLAQGEHKFTIKATDAAGNESEASDPFSFTVDSIAPALPEITSITDAVGDITGALALNAVTNDARPTLAGKAEAGTKVTIYDQGVEIGTVTADANGTWTYRPDADLSEGGHSFSVTATDAAGNVSPASKGFTITVDTVAPDAPQFTTGYDSVGPVVGEFNSGGIINDNRPKLSGAGAEPNAVVHIYKDGVLAGTVKADAGGQWSWKSPTALTDGSYSFTATVTDTAGNVSAASEAFTVTVDTVAPNAPVIELITDDQEPITGTVDKGGFTNDTTPTLSGSGAEANGTVRIYDGAILLGEVKADADGKWSFTPENALGSGVHSFTIVAVDAAGNVSAKWDVYSVTVDTLAPNAPVITQVLDDVGSVTGAVANGKSTDDTKPTLSGSGAEAGSTVNIYDNGVLLGSTKANANGTWSFTPTTDLSEGTHSFTVTATDAAGNEGSASMPWVVVVDTTPPDASFKPEIINALDDQLPVTGSVGHNEFTNDTTPRLIGKGAEPNGFIRIYSEGKLLGQVQADANGNWSFDVPTLAEGKHSFIAKTVDEAGNEGSASSAFTLTVDTTHPLATDAAITEVKDAVAPHEGNIATGGLTNDARPVISGTAVDGITLVRLYDGNTLLGEVSVTNGEWSFRPESALSDGVHNFRVKAVDAAGNEGPHSSTWSVTVDTTAPNAPAITMVYDDVNAVQGNVADGKSTDDRKPTLSGGNAEAGSTVKIYDKGVLIGETVADSKGVWSFTPDTDLADGAHVFTVTATDKAGNESVPSASWTITVDLSVPETPKILQIWDDTNPGIGPVGKGETTNDTTPTLSGSAAAGTVVKIFVNGELLGETVATAANTWSYTGFVSDGTHTFTVQSVNAVGTAGALSEPFMIIVSTAVSGTPSITTVLDDVGSIKGTVGNGKPTDDVQPEIKGTADANATVNIYDNGSFIGKVIADANGDWTFTPTTSLTEGNHALTAKMVDGAGVEGQPSFPYVIIVDTTAPDAPRFTVGYDAVGPVIGEFSDGAIINDNRPKLSGAGAEPNAVVTIYKDGAVLATVKADAGGQWSWKATDAIADGTYVFTAKTTDTAGNVSAASDNFTLTVDTVPPAKPVITSVYDDQEPIVANVAKDGFTNDTTPTISGSGVWSYIPVNPLSNGPHTFTVVAVDAAGNVSEKSDPYKITVDTLAPSAPSITNVVDTVGPVTGTVNNGKSTDDTKPRLSGSGAESGSVVKVYDNGTLIGQTIANANGTWSFTPTVGLSEGAHTFTVTATDAAGNESGESIAWTVVVDLTPPSKPEITAVYDDVAPGIGNVPNGTATNDPTPTLNGKGDAGTTIRIYEGADLLGETIVRANGTWSFTAPLQEDGLRTFTVTSVDEAGNVSATSNSWSVVISTIPPEIPKIEYLYNNNGAENVNIPNTNVTNDQDPLLTGTSQPNLVIRIYDNGMLVGSTTADADGKWSFNFRTANVKLSEGYHSISVAAVNELGFEGSQSFPRIVTIDITPPPPPAITSAADDVGSIINSNMLSGSLTDDTLPSFRGTTDAYHVIKLYRDGGIVVGQAIADGTGNWVIQLTEPLESKTHNFYATATDPAGNVSTSNSNTFKLTVDAIAPDAPVITRIVDNVPDHTGTIEKGGLTNDPAPRVEGTGEANATINIYAGSLLVGTVKANSSGSWSLKLPKGLPDGSYVITATATDLAGNTGPASAGYTIVVDTRAPYVPRITHVVDDVEGHVGNIENRQTTNDNLPLIVGTGEKGTTIAVYDNGNYLGTTVVGADGSWSYQVVRVLGDGTHKFTATATDPAGNTTGSSNTLEIIMDTVAPNSPRIDDAYDSELGRTMSSGTYTKDKTPTLRGTAEAYSIVEIFDDVYGVIGTTTANGSGGWSFTLPDSKGLPDGVYNFKARATDLAGNTGPAMGTGFRLIIDTVPPVAPLIEQIIDAVAGGIVGNIPSNGLTNDTYPTLTGKAEAGTTLTFYGGLNGTSNLGTIVVPASGVWTWKSSYLSNGEHKFVVKSVDAAGNETYSKAPYVITVDSSAPSTPTLTSVYDSTQPVVGNISSNGWTNETKPTFQGTAEAGSTLTIIHNGVEVGTVQVGPDGKWTWKPTTDLSDGSNNFNFKATDAAGNTSGSTSTFYINVDTVPPVAPEITRIYDNVSPITGDVPKNGYTNDATPTIYVTAEAYSTVIIYDNGVEVARTTLGNTTSWNWTPSQNISEGDHVYTVKQIDRAGQESPLSEPWKIIVDLLAPPAPKIEQIWDDVDLYTGAIEQGKLTNDNMPTVSGSGIAGTKVTVYANGSAVGTVIVGADGKWSLTTSKLSEGAVLLTARAEDEAGNQSTDSNSWAISVDTYAPVIGNYTSDTRTSIETTFDQTKTHFTINGSILVNQLGVKAFAMLDGKIIATADVDPITGGYKLEVPFAETKGWNAYKFGIMDEAGNLNFWVNYVDYEIYAQATLEPYDTNNNQYFYINNSENALDKPIIRKYYDGTGLRKGWFLSEVPTVSTAVSISGYSKYAAGSKIEVYNNGVLLGWSNVGSYGNWSYTVNNLTEGVHNLTAVYVNAAGQKSAASEVFKLTVDFTPPAIPEITEIIADEGIYAGVVTKNGQTNDKTLELKGKTEPYASVRIYNGSTQIGEVKADKDGN